jgi:hypothetical protein
MKEVFVVTSGEYSDYTIDAIFDSKELALKYIGYDPSKINQRYNTIGIETFVLNIGHNQKGFIYYVCMDRYGKTHICYIVNDLSKIPNKKYTIQLEPHLVKKENKHTIRIFVRAKSKEHAIKIVNEKRTQLIVKGKM